MQINALERKVGELKSLSVENECVPGGSAGGCSPFASFQRSRSSETVSGDGASRGAQAALRRLQQAVECSVCKEKYRGACVPSPAA